MPQDSSSARGTTPTARADQSPAASRSPARWTTAAAKRLVHELAAFGVVGGVAFVVDVGLFNLLRFHHGSPLVDKPITDKVISASVATLVSWVGNRWWTYRHQRRSAVVAELVLFGVMNALALLLAVACLAVSHYVFGLTSALADNVSGIVGIGLGTAFRFVAYRFWVFRSHAPGHVATDGASDDSPDGAFDTAPAVDDDPRRPLDVRADV